MRLDVLCAINRAPPLLPSDVRRALLGVRAKGIACGNDFSLVLGEEGELHSFGDNRAGQLGRPSATPGEPSPGGRPVPSASAPR